MKKNYNKQTVLRLVQNTGIGLMILGVVGLTAAIIALLTMNAAVEDVPFRMEQLTATKDAADIDLDRYFLPAFLGISAKGEQRGISAGNNMVRELYAQLQPVLADVLSGQAKEITSTEFAAAAEESAFVYLRYHTSIPVQVIHACAGGEATTYDKTVYVYDLFILPDKGFRILVRGVNGSAYSFVGTYEPYFTVDTLWDQLQSYQRSFSDFQFTRDSETVSALGEPQFTERVRTKNMLVTEKTATLMWENESHLVEILRLMDFNPDKVYTYDESGQGYVFVENHGVLRLLNDSLEYTAASTKGGIPVAGFFGRYSMTEITLADYIGAACSIADRIKSLSAHYAGGDGEILLTSAETAADGTLSLQFIYTFDNLRLADCDPALEVQFQDGKLVDFRLYTVSMRNLGTQEDSFYEQWYCKNVLDQSLNKLRIVDTRLVYPTDFYAESISARWSAVCSRLPVQETSNRTRN